MSKAVLATLISISVLALVTIVASQDLADALERQLAIVAESPTAENLNDLGNLLVHTGDLEQAVEIYDRSLLLEPDNTTTLYNKALVEVERGNHKSAMRLLERILEIDPFHAWAHYQMGTIHAEDGDRKKAVDHYSRAFLIDPDLTSPAVNPHIVENRLATEAMLRAYRERTSSADDSPRLYEEPAGIANMLLYNDDSAVTGTSEPEPTSEVTTATELEPSHSQGVVARPSLPDDAEPPSDETFDETLDDTEETRSEGSADPQVIDESTLAVGVAPLNQSTGFPSKREERQQRRQAPPAPTAPPPAAGSSTAPGARPEFVPSVSSTGRLDLELIPNEEFDSGRLATG